MDITIILIILNILGVFTFSWWHLLWMIPVELTVDAILTMLYAIIKAFKA